jgi:hypothetical protein
VNGRKGMAQYLAAFLLLMVLCAPARGQFEKRTVDSANRKYRVVIDQDPAIVPKEGEAPEAIATMLEIATGEVKWRRKIGDALFLMANRTYVSEKGEFFVAMSLGDAPKVYSTNGVVELALTKAENEPDANSFLRIFELDSVGSKEIFRIWNPVNDEWQAFNLPEGSTLKPTEAMRAAWNEKTRADILVRRANYEKALMQQRLFAKSTRLAAAAKLLPKKDVETLEDIDCVFLADRKIPADRKWFQAMLQTKDFPTSPMQSLFRARGSGGLWFEETDAERRRADATLAIFDGKAKYNPVEGLLRAKPYLLGEVSGRVKLSTPVLSHPGEMRIYLIPAGWEKRAWIDLRETERLGSVLPTMTPENAKDVVGFTFGSVTPGRFFAKAIWDKRRPFDDRAKAGPGDYESALIGPFTLTAGTTLTNIVIECTNRVSGGETYYAADGLARRKWQGLRGK